MNNYNFAKIQNDIPSDLMAKAVSAKAMGINDYLWKWNDALRLIDLFVEHKLPILGGDVYEYIDNNLKYTDNSWSISKRDLFAPSENYIVESKNLAFTYIKNYIKKNGENYYFLIII